MLIDGTVPVPSTRVREISSYTSLEEALATCNKMDPIIHQVLIAALGVLRTVCPRTPFFWEVALRQKAKSSISFDTTKLANDTTSYSRRTEPPSDLCESNEALWKLDLAQGIPKNKPFYLQNCVLKLRIRG
jgi:hypothetical protein